MGGARLRASVMLTGLGLSSPVQALASPDSADCPREPLALATDRPGNGNAATTLGACTLDIEASALYAMDQSGGERSVQLFSLPTLLRYGVVQGVEVRLGHGLFGVERVEQTHIRSTDASLGMKLQPLAQNGITPDLALMTDVFLPTGSGAFSNDAVVPEARIAAAWSLGAGLGLLLNAGADVPRVSADRVVRDLYVVNLGSVVPGTGGTLSVFAELFGRGVLSERTPHTPQFDVGAAWLVSDRVQLDCFTQHGLSDAATDFQVALGVSTLFGM